MTEKPINISAKDCLPFNNTVGNEAAIESFLKQSDQFEKFHLLQAQSNKERPDLAYFDLKNGWTAGRMVGEARFNHDKIKYIFSVKPRFGEVHLFRMLSEIFNVRFTDVEGEYDKSDSEQVLVKKLISFLWLSLLSKGNRYGLPRRTKYNDYYGDKIRGRLRVRDSLISMKTDGKLHSSYKSKALDENIAKLLKLSYQILDKKYFLSKIHKPRNATYAIEKINSFNPANLWVSKQDYRDIQYKEIYKTFKPVIDLSWDIIQSENINSKAGGRISPIGYFIDMAEIWELYVKSLLTKELGKSGWVLISNEYQTYKSPILNRTLRPDMVYKKNKEVLVFDAKYKLMEGRKKDIDRTDYFQIHTYIHYLQQEYNVIAGGLIYPFSEPFTPKMVKDTRSLSLYSKGGIDTTYFVDGIDLSFMSNGVDSNQLEDMFSTAEEAFINRILKLVSRTYRKTA